jgi:hypothetical protein
MANSTAGTVALQVPYPNLAAAFDNVGVTSNSNTNPTPDFSVSMASARLIPRKV